MNNFSIKLLLVVFSFSIFASKTFGDTVVIDEFDINDMTSNRVNLTTEKFYNSLISKKPYIRDRAKLFLLGVTDATEGRVWCGYKIAKTITIQEIIFEEIKKLPKEELKSRAAHKIEEILSNKLPCRDK